MRARRDGQRDGGQALPLLCVVLALAGAGLVALAIVGRAAIDRGGGAHRSRRRCAGWRGGRSRRRGRGGDRQRGGLVELPRRRPRHRGGRSARRATATARARRDGAPSGRRVRRRPRRAGAGDCSPPSARPMPCSASRFRSCPGCGPVPSRRRCGGAGTPTRIPVAPPGTSRHESGRAVDVPARVRRRACSPWRPAPACANRCP